MPYTSLIDEQTFNPEPLRQIEELLRLTGRELVQWTEGIDHHTLAVAFSGQKEISGEIICYMNGDIATLFHQELETVGHVSQEEIETCRKRVIDAVNAHITAWQEKLRSFRMPEGPMSGLKDYVGSSDAVVKRIMGHMRKESLIILLSLEDKDVQKRFFDLMCKDPEKWSFDYEPFAPLTFSYRQADQSWTFNFDLEGLYHGAAPYEIAEAFDDLAQAIDLEKTGKKPFWLVQARRSASEADAAPVSLSTLYHTKHGLYPQGSAWLEKITKDEIAVKIEILIDRYISHGKYALLPFLRVEDNAFFQVALTHIIRFRGMGHNQLVNRLNTMKDEYLAGTESKLSAALKWFYIFADCFTDVDERARIQKDLKPCEGANTVNREALEAYSVAEIEAKFENYLYRIFKDGLLSIHKDVCDEKCPLLEDLGIMYLATISNRQDLQAYGETLRRNYLRTAEEKTSMLIEGLKLITQNGTLYMHMMMKTWLDVYRKRDDQVKHLALE